MESDVKWLIGLAVTFFLAHTGILIGVFRSMFNKMSNGNRSLYDHIDAGNTGIEEKIDNVKEKYVRRDDLDGHLQRLDNSVKDLQRQIRDQSKQSREQNDKVLAAITSNNN